MGSSSSLSLSAPAYSMTYAPSSSSSPSPFPPSSSMSATTYGGGYGPSSTTGAAPPPPAASSYYSPYAAGPPSASSSSPGYGYAASSYASPGNNPSTPSSSTHTYPPYYYASYSPYPLSASTPSPSRHTYPSQPSHAQPSPSDPAHGVVPLGPSSLSLPAPASASVASVSATSSNTCDFGGPMSIGAATTQQQQRPQRRTSPQRSGAEIPLPQLEAYPSIMSPRMPSPPPSSGSEPSTGVPPAATAPATDTGSAPQSVQRIKREAAHGPDGSAPKAPRKRTTNSLVKSLSEARNGKPRANTTAIAGTGVVPHGAGNGEDSDNDVGGCGEDFTMVHEWTDIDDAILLAAIQASSSIEDVVRKGYLTNHFTAEEIKARWHAILYDQPTAEACAARLAEIEFDLPLLAYLEQRPPHVASPDKPHELPPAEVKNTAEVDASSHAPPGTFATASSASTSASTSTSVPISFTTEELDGLRFSEMEAKLLAAMPHSTLDFFSRIARKEAYWREGERVQDQILRVENELKLITEKKLKMLALLRGRYLRYEMKSKEIVLGRTAGDAVVDVDLSEEGDAAKISRRQAVIKLKRDGEFYVHNVGRATIFVNGRSVPTGKRMRLTHCCLVEVRQIAFIFEINRSLHAKLKAGLTAITTSIGAATT